MGGGGPSIPERSLTDEFGQIKGLYKQQENQYGKFIKKDPLLGGAYGAAGSLFGPMASQILPVIQSGGALTTEQMRAADQASLGLSSQAGMANSNAGIAGALLNREQYRQQRLGTAINQYGALQGQTLAPFSTGISGFSKLTNPLLSYASDLFSSNQNAAATESIAGANKSSGAMGGAMSAIGSIAGAAMMASDERIKTGIKDTGKTTPEGIPIKTGRYKTDPSKRRFEFVLAQDVEKRVPQAVVTDPVSGLKMVDYRKVNAPFFLLSEAGKAA